jgi:hypothetical protein
MCEYFRVLTCNLTGWAEYVDAYESVMKVKHIELAGKQNSFILRDNNHHSGMCTLAVILYACGVGAQGILDSSTRALWQLPAETSSSAVGESWGRNGW